MTRKWTVPWVGIRPVNGYNRVWTLSWLLTYLMYHFLNVIPCSHNIVNVLCNRVTTGRICHWYTVDFIVLDVKRDTRFSIEMGYVRILLLCFGGNLVHESVLYSEILSSNSHYVSLFTLEIKRGFIEGTRRNTSVYQSLY